MASERPLEIALAPAELRRALAEIERAERNGFLHCLAVITVATPMDDWLKNRVGTYSDLIERAHPTNSGLDWGRGQQITRSRRFVDGALVPIPDEVARMAKEPVDRKGWAAGAWDGEPDRAEWRDTATGLPCLAVRNRFGAWCGYVGVPPTHPLHGKGYSDVDADAHGGLTYSGACSAHICHTPAPGEPENIHWFGFDCNHSGDFAPGMDATLRQAGGEGLRVLRDDGRPYEEYRTLDYVREECRSLAAQLAEIGR